jgi:glycine/D-amino acid oxidase-like deaminating enzyme
MLPAMADAQVAHQTACLRPLASDGLLVLGRVPGLEHAYVATGAGRKGILFGPAMGRAIADLIVSGSAEIDLTPSPPGASPGSPLPDRSQDPLVFVPP